MKTIMWKVDMQYDFMRNDEVFKGALPIQDAEQIIPNAKKITELAKKNGIKIVSTADWHYETSPEISNNPDFKETYPPHCMADTYGAKIIEEVELENPLILDWQAHNPNLEQIARGSEILIRKDKFDVFKGNPYTQDLLDIMSPQKVVVYGVATNVCVDQAVTGLRKTVPEVYVVLDAIKHLPDNLAQKSLSDTIKGWYEGDNPVKLIDTNQVGEYLK